MENPWPDSVAHGAALRAAVRVLLVDPDSRLLLFRYIGDEGERFWCPTGGGIDPGESPEVAARREVREETGWSGPLELVEVWHRRHVALFLGQLVDQREQWFLARVPVFSVHTGGFTELERQTISEWRWWSVADLHNAPERLVPDDLAARVEALLASGPPKRPFEIGT